MYIRDRGILRRLWEWFNKPVPKPTVEGELFPGVQRPTRTLALMIASELIKQDVDLTIQPERNNSSEDNEKMINEHGDLVRMINYSLRYNTYEWEGKVRNLQLRVSEVNRYKVNLDDFIPTISIQKDGKDVFLPPEDLAVVKEGIVTAIKLTKEREKVKELYDQQQQAVDLIADWMGVPSKEDIIAEGKMKCC